MMPINTSARKSHDTHAFRLGIARAHAHYSATNIRCKQWPYSADSDTQQSLLAFTSLHITFRSLYCSTSSLSYSSLPVFTIQLLLFYNLFTLRYQCSLLNLYSVTSSTIPLPVLLSLSNSTPVLSQPSLLQHWPFPAITVSTIVFSSLS